MLVTLSGIVMLCKGLQPLKAFPPILLTLSGIVMFFMEEHQAKAPSPMVVTLSGIVMLVKDSQLPKARSPMLVTLSGIVTFVNPPGTATSVFPSFVNKRPEVDLKEGLPESTEKDVRLGQSMKAPISMLVTLSGIITFVNPPGTATSVFPSFVNKSP